MWGAQSHGVSAKNWLRRTLQKNVERRALSDLRDDLLDIATEIAYLDPSMTVSKIRHFSGWGGLLT